MRYSAFEILPVVKRIVQSGDDFPSLKIIWGEDWSRNTSILSLRNARLKLMITADSRNYRKCSRYEGKVGEYFSLELQV